MDIDVYSRAGLKPSAIQRQCEPGNPRIDDIEVARRRMRHLAPWNVKPLPIMHHAFSSQSDDISLDTRERSRRVALQVLAVQIWHTAVTSALKR